MMRKGLLYVLLALFIGACSLMKNSKPEESASDLYNRGLDMQLQGEYSKALELYNQSIKIDSTDSQAYLNRGVVKGNLDDIEGAMSDYLLAHRFNPKSPVSLNNIACIYAEKGENDKAVEFFKKAFEVDSLYAVTYYNYGISLFDNKEYREAVNNFIKYRILENITIKRYIDEQKTFELEDYYNNYKYSLYYTGLSYKYLQNMDSAKVYLHKAVDRGVTEAIDSLKTLK